jgi:transcriptional regulator with XRE-family HTH domain
MNSQFLRNIDLFLAARNENQTELARHLGLPKNTVSNWKARGTIPSADVVYKIAKYFGVPMEYILYGEENSLDDDIILAIAKLKTIDKEKRKVVIDLLCSQVDYWKNKD